jgi:hypothetical protein
MDMKYLFSGTLATLAFLACSLCCLAQTPSLTVLSPPDSTTVNAGDQFVITIDQPIELPDFYFNRGVMLVSSGPFVTSRPLTADPFRFQITVRSDAQPGDYAITAVGSRDGQLTYSSPLHLIVPAGDVQSIVVNPNSLRLPAPGAIGLLSVKGITSHSQKIALPLSQINFSVDNSNIAAIDALGRVAAKAVGAATITVNYTNGSQNLTTAVQVQVLSKGQ